MNSLRRRAILLSLALFLLLLVSVLGIILAPYWQPHTGTPVAFVILEGTVVKRIPLDQTAVDDSFLLKTAEGHYNEIVVTNGKIGIRSADCPSQLCVKQGYLHPLLPSTQLIPIDPSVPTTTLPLICLPHRLVIEIRYEQNSLDGVSY
ncbi:MAG: NusG domain II-containing protein [Lachnospiraceae bacterium]|jgi:hypothetical protein|nr:NusG domain II-containing protein [Lachnospiraceae bacterium]